MLNSCFIIFIGIGRWNGRDRAEEEGTMAYSVFNVEAAV